MIKEFNRNLKAARLRTVKLAATVTGDIEAGEHFELNANGEAVKCTGTKRGLPTLDSRNSKRDSITPNEGMITLVEGPFSYETDQIDSTCVATFGTKLKVHTNGKLIHADNVAANEALAVAYANGTYTSGGYLEVVYE